MGSVVKLSQTGANGSNVHEGEAPTLDKTAGRLAVSIHPDVIGRSGENTSPSVDGAGVVRRRDAGLGISDDGASHTLNTGAPPAVFNLRGREDGAQAEPDELASVRAASGGSSRSYVYGETEEGDACAFDPQPDGPRYAACGDAVTVNVGRWIGERLARMG